MERILAVDIGGGTQDILLWERDKPLENCIQMILPSPTVLVAEKIREATRQRKTVFLYGHIMGGGPSVKAVKEHLLAGLDVYAAAEAALTISDNPEQTAALGVVITDDPPREAVKIRLGDLDLPLLSGMVQAVGRSLPDDVAVAVQDHGYSPHESNRIFRFRLWEQFMAGGGKLSDLAYRRVPKHYTRMQAVQKDAPGALLMDTCGAALLGALTDERVGRAAEAGVAAVVNLGNQHTFAALVHKDRVLGIFEHHTGMMTAPIAQGYLKRFFTGELSCLDVQEDGGHGCMAPIEPVTPDVVAITGPRRGLLASLGYYFAAPQGNMMLMGPFGLVAAMVKKEG